MRKSLEIRRALGETVDLMAKHAEQGGAEYDTAKARKVELESELARAVEVEGALAGNATPRDADVFAQPNRDYIPFPALKRERGRRELDGAMIAEYVREANAHLDSFGMGVAKDKQFRSFGEQLQAVAHYAMSSRTGDSGALDGRLVRAGSDARVSRAPSGAAVVDPTSGGFLVQTDFSTSVFMRAYELGKILAECSKVTISTGANGIKIPGIDETSRATGSRYGGVQSYWIAEGTSITASKPKFRLVELDLKKLASAMYVTDELLADSNALTQIAMKAFSEEIMFMTEDAVVEGDGTGKPQGILNASALVSVAKENGQAAGTIVKENIDKMWARCWARSREKAVWFINQDVEPQLNQMGQVVGTGGLPVYLPPGGLSQSPFGTLMGRPVVPVEYCAALGTAGDIILADFSQYMLADKGGVQAASSMHVQFLTDEMTFRITYRVDGQPLWHSALTPFKGSLTKSPFVVIAAR